MKIAAIVIIGLMSIVYGLKIVDKE